MLLSFGPILMQTILAPFFLKTFLADISFFLKLTIVYVFVLRNILLQHKLKKESDLTTASYLHMQDLGLGFGLGGTMDREEPV